MNMRIYNVRILTMEDGRDIFWGELWIQGSRITYVGPATEKQPVKWDEEINGQGNLLMPGFKNAHTHSAMTFLRSHADDMKLDTWLNTCVFPAEAKLTGEDVYWLTKLAVMEYLTSGMTAMFDMYFYREEMSKSVREAGFRTVFCESINDFGGTLQEVEADYKRYNDDPEDLVSYQLGFHAEYTTSKELMKGIVDLSEKYKAPICVHCSETRHEVEDCRKRTGMTPVAYMESQGVFKNGGCGFHFVHLDETDFEIIKRNELYAVTNPASNLKLASGIAPVKKMMDMGIPVAIGTDGPASNNCLDMFREMFLTSALQKVVLDDPEVVPAMEVLKMATVNGAYAMGLSECDVLKEGKKADMILIDLHQPNMHPLQNIEKNLVYSGSKQNVKTTIINGRMLYNDGEFYIGSSTEEIYEKVNEIAKRILAK